MIRLLLLEYHLVDRLVVKFSFLIRYRFLAVCKVEFEVSFELVVQKLVPDGRQQRLDRGHVPIQHPAEDGQRGWRQALEYVQQCAFPHLQVRPVPSANGYLSLVLRQHCPAVQITRQLTSITSCVTLTNPALIMCCFCSCAVLNFLPMLLVASSSLTCQY